MSTAQGASDFGEARSKLLRGSRLHWVHWLVVALSLALTFGAWHVTKQQVNDKVASRFQREARQVVELVAERMRRYEDALWGGVGAHAATYGSIDRLNWRAFAESLNLEEKYPGINGIGVIHAIGKDELQHYIARERLFDADFAVHPTHGESEHFPITYIEPEDNNRQAIGLDVAHESNRYTAAKKARDTGTAQITGPIVLVQDAEKTPGFLFYAPFYRHPPQASVASRREQFLGLVYAPFVMQKLMNGVLDKDARHVGISIRDGDSSLYNELSQADSDFDPDPMFSRQTNIELYGRNWTFDVQSSKSFREAAGSSQPQVILLSGLLIDALLLILFVTMSRINRQAVTYVDAATAELRRRTQGLERSNADLEQFAYAASHDLQEPLRMIGNFSQLLQRLHAGERSEKSDQYFDFVLSGVKRMQLLLNDLLEYSRVGVESKEPVAVSATTACENAIRNLRAAIDDAQATLTIDDLPTVFGDENLLTRLFQNLLGNALKFRDANRALQISVTCQEHNSGWRFAVSDNGIGIEARYFDKIFIMFQRLHGREVYSGTGVGLAICKKILLAHGGMLWVESEYGTGTTFFFTLPKAHPARASSDSPAVTATGAHVPATATALQAAENIQ